MTCAGDRRVVCDSDVYILLGIIYHAVDGIYVKASVFRAKKFVFKGFLIHLFFCYLNF